MGLSRRFADQGVNVSHQKTAPNYAPKLFAEEAEAKKNNLRKCDFETAMRNLFATNKIHVESYGRPSRPYSRLAVLTVEGKPGDYY
jgi:hypothetical protein